MDHPEFHKVKISKISALDYHLFWLNWVLGILILKYLTKIDYEVGSDCPVERRRLISNRVIGFTSSTWMRLETKTTGDVFSHATWYWSRRRRKRRSLSSVAVQEVAVHGSLAPSPDRCPPHTYGSPPAHLHRPDRRRGCPGLRAFHRPQLLL